MKLPPNERAALLQWAAKEKASARALQAKILPPAPVAILPAAHATRAAVEEGIVPGGGVALARASLILSQLKGDNDDQRFGIDIVRKAIQAPLRQIAENAGEDGAVVAGKVLDKSEYSWGFDAQSGDFKDLVKSGIIDPTKVVRTALQDASSVAGLLVTTEAMVAEKPEKKAPPMPPGGGGMGDMDF